MDNENTRPETGQPNQDIPSSRAIHFGETASSLTKKATNSASNLANGASRAVSETAVAVRETATSVGSKASQAVANAATYVGDLNGDGVIDAEDLKIARGYAASTLSSVGEGLSAAGSVVGQEAGNLAKSVARAPLTKDVATYAAVGAAISIPLPIVGLGIGAAVGAALGLWRNMTRHETLIPETPTDPLAKLERLHELKEKGIISADDFLVQKRKLLQA